MTLNFIEYLESKYFDTDEILFLQKKALSSKTEDVDLMKKMESIYKIFGFAGLPMTTVNKLIINNYKMLLLQDHELINIAYTWAQTGLLSEAAERTAGINYNNYLRTYLRNLYLNSGLNYLKSPISYNALKMGDMEFSSDYCGYYPNDKSVVLNPYFEVLVNLFGKGDNYDEKLESIKRHVSTSALKWYLDCLKKTKEKLNGLDDNGRII